MVYGVSIAVVLPSGPRQRFGAAVLSRKPKTGLWIRVHHSDGSFFRKWLNLIRLYLLAKKLKQTLCFVGSVFGLGVEFVTPDGRDELRLLLQQHAQRRLALRSAQSGVDPVQLILAPFCERKQGKHVTF